MLITDLRFDLRAPDFSVGSNTLMKTALDMAEYGDRHGFNAVMLSEHHGTDDNYLPSPIVFGAAIAARTQHVKLLLSAMIVPLHDPLRLAEDLAVLDQISNGRVELVAAGGYVTHEFDMFDKDLSKRGRYVSDTITTLRQAWTGQPFSYRDRTVKVTPTPVQDHLPIHMGGSVPAAAKRAGRLADGFITHDPELYQVYYDTALAHGKSPEPFPQRAPGYMFVSEDPDKTWEQIAPYAMHETNEYGRWQAAAGTDSIYRPVDSIEALKASRLYVVVTPERCIELCKKFGSMLIHPLVGGLDPEIGWRSLELYVEKVLPEFQ